MFNFNKNFLDRIIKRDKEKIENSDLLPEHFDTKKTWFETVTENPEGNRGERFETDQTRKIEELKKDIVQLQNQKKIAAENHDISEFGEIHPAVFEMMRREIQDINDKMDKKQKEIDDLVGNN